MLSRRPGLRSKELSEPSREKRDAFKVELERALVEHYPVSPQLFERWTDESGDLGSCAERCKNFGMSALVSRSRQSDCRVRKGEAGRKASRRCRCTVRTPYGGA